jgi:hypothetical protein
MPKPMARRANAEQQNNDDDFHLLPFDLFDRVPPDGGILPGE